MPDPDDIDPIIDKRLTDLEVKASFGEDLVDHLNDLVARQQEQIDLLIREVGKLKDRAPEMFDSYRFVTTGYYRHRLLSTPSSTRS